MVIVTQSATIARWTPRVLSSRHEYTVYDAGGFARYQTETTTTRFRVSARCRSDHTRTAKTNVVVDPEPNACSRRRRRCGFCRAPVTYYYRGRPRYAPQKRARARRSSTHDSLSAADPTPTLHLYHGPSNYLHTMYTHTLLPRCERRTTIFYTRTNIRQSVRVRAPSECVRRCAEKKWRGGITKKYIYIYGCTRNKRVNGDGGRATSVVASL